MGLTSPDRQSIRGALSGLTREFPDFLDKIRGKRIVDFGCGGGYQSVAMALNGAEQVVGFDINTSSLRRAQQLAASTNVGSAVKFQSPAKEDLREAFDIVISLNSFEHFSESASVLSQMGALVRPGGRIYIVFGPLWYSPYGSHMHYFCKVPWVNLLFAEDTVMKVRSRFRDDGATRYEEVEGGLNRMTVSKFTRVVTESEYTIEHLNFRCVKGIDFISRVPYLRELFVNTASCILRKRPHN